MPPITDLAWFRSRIQERLPSLELSARQMEELYFHYELLRRWNVKMNLTSIRSPEEIVVQHYCESLFFAVNVPDLFGAAEIADIGSGAGFPGIPMAILRPDWRLTLIESHQRKCVFLRESSRALKNVSVLPKRAEEVSSHFDWIVSRAVRPQEVLSLVSKLAPCVGLLIGASDFEDLRNTAAVDWAQPIEVPWSVRRVCAYSRTG